MQHVQVEGYQPSFIISGAGGASLYEVKPTDRGFVENHHLGFNHLHVTPDEINIQYIAPKENACTTSVAINRAE